MPFIELENVSFSYGDILAVNNVSLAFDSRKTVIIGPNGSGKTTLTRLIKGLLTPSRGQIRVNGGDISKKSARELAGLVGLVFQNPNDQIFSGTVLGEAMFGPKNLKPADARERAMDALAFVGLADSADENPHDLSMSEKRLLCVASVLSMDARAIILDEPTASLDADGRDIIRRVIADCVQAGKPVIAVSHDMDDLLETYERVVILSQGKVVFDGETKEALSNEGLLASVGLEQPALYKLKKRAKELYYSSLAHGMDAAAPSLDTQIDAALDAMLKLS